MNSQSDFNMEMAGRVSALEERIDAHDLHVQDLKDALKGLTESIKKIENKIMLLVIAVLLSGAPNAAIVLKILGVSH